MDTESFQDLRPCYGSLPLLELIEARVTGGPRWHRMAFFTFSITQGVTIEC